MLTKPPSHSFLYKAIGVAFLFYASGGVSIVAAATDINTPVITDTVWSQVGSPYIVTGAMTVAAGVTLTIQEGVVVKFNDIAGLTVSGNLLIQGQSGLPVTLTSIHDDTVAGDTNQNGTSTKPGGEYYRWSGVTFAPGSTGDISNSKFYFAGFQKTGVPPKPAVYNQGGTVAIRDSVFEKNWQFGAGQTSGSLTITDTVFDLQNIGVAVKSGDISITRTTFKNASHYGLMVGGAGALTISESDFINNSYPAGLWLDAARQIQISDNQTSGGYENGILLRGPVVGDVTLPQTGGISYLVSGVGGTPDGAGSLSFSNSNGLEVSTGSSLTLTNGAILKSKNEVGIEVKGGLNFLGTPADPVIYTAINDNTVGGTVKAATTPPSFGSGGYLRFHPGSTGEINNATIKYGSNAYHATASTLINNGGVVHVTDSAITENKYYAIYQLAGTTTIHTSSISNLGRQGIFNSLATPLDATNNYWGDPTGPKHPTINPTGLGASISDNVSVTPWLGAYPPEPPAPLGASSVLFLPGIMGSRLYEDSAECANEGGEKQRWFSTDECEQLRLRTDFTGQSLNTLYTKPNESAVIDNVLLVSPLYGDFLERLADEKENETIADYRAVPYDWRLRLEDILKTREENGKIVFDQSSSYQQSYVYKSLEELVSSSKSGKVTIVAHSNGGLLAKALLAEMVSNNDPLLDKIDNLILVAVPQVGTPDAVVSILHGAEIARGFLIKGEVSRQIVNTAPFSHHLLPSEQYFSPEGSSVQTPVIKIESGSVTDSWRTQFGAEITTHQDLINFLSKDSGRVKPATDDLLNPEVVDNFLLNYADSAHSVQSAFVPPSTMKVSQVAGTGVGTPSSLTYFTDKECVSRSIFSFFRCTEYRDKLGYRAVFASDGDGTVVLPSALAMSETNQVERVWVDLDRYNKSRLFSLVHRNILEVPDIQDFVFNAVEATTTRQYNYLSTAPVESATEDRLVFQLHSPLDMWVTTGNGLVGSSTNEVDGALYERLGELQYIEVPATGEDVQVHLLGQKTGSFTLDIERWTGGSLAEQVDYVGVPTATGTKVTSEIKSVLSASVLELDLEGNGTVDGDMTAEGELIERNVVSYPVLITTIEQLSLKKSLKQVLIATIKSAEYYSSKTPTSPLYLKLEDALLTASSDLIKLYAKRGYISASDSEVLLGMIQILKNKQ